MVKFPALKQVGARVTKTHGARAGHPRCQSKICASGTGITLKSGQESDVWQDLCAHHLCYFNCLYLNFFDKFLFFCLDGRAKLWYINPCK